MPKKMIAASAVVFIFHRLFECLKLTFSGSIFSTRLTWNNSFADTECLMKGRKGEMKKAAPKDGL